MMKWVVCSSICLAQSSADTPGEALRSAHSAATGHAETPGEGFGNSCSVSRPPRFQFIITGGRISQTWTFANRTFRPSEGADTVAGMTQRARCDSDLTLEIARMSVFTVTLTKSYQDEKIGVGLVPVPNTDPLRLEVISLPPTFGSPVSRWNSENPSRQVRPGQRIIAVNNLAGQNMVAEIKQSVSVVELRIWDPKVLRRSVL